MARKGLQFLGQPRLVDERNLLGRRLQEKVERVDDRHLGDEIDFDRQLCGRFGKYEPRQKIAVRVLLPIDEMLRRAGPSANSS